MRIDEPLLIGNIGFRICAKPIVEILSQCGQIGRRAQTLGEEKFLGIRVLSPARDCGSKRRTSTPNSQGLIQRNLVKCSALDVECPLANTFGVGR